MTTLFNDQIIIENESITNDKRVAINLVELEAKVEVLS